MLVLKSKRSALLASVCLLPALFSYKASAQFMPVHQHAASRQMVGDDVIARNQRIEDIEVHGNDRIETSTILSYMVARPGDTFNQDDLDRSLKTLYATGLFKDVVLHRSGSVLQVQVVENPIVNRIVFEGNHAAKDEDLRKVIGLRPRAVFTAEAAASDRQKILEVYAQKARYGADVTPQLIKLAHNRVDVVFQVNEGPQTLIRRIAFVGNRHFSEAQLASVVSSKETAWYRFFSSADQYNPERLRYDGELLRRYYLANGFVDFQMINATGEMSPDRKSFFVTFTIKEGPRYRLGKIDIRSSLRHMTAVQLRKYVELYPNQWYDGNAVQQNVTNMEETLQSEGYPFAMVRPEIARNPEKQIVNLLFDVSEGPRMYVERLDINGNTVTRDNVIRRQMPMSEGDPYTPVLKKYAKQSLEDLGYFKTVSINQGQGSAPDKVNVSTSVVEKPTGEFSLGGGYSTDVGVIGNIGLKQHNLLGTGVDAGISGTMAMWQRQVDASITDPYFLNRNLVVGADLFYINNHYQTYQNYSESRYGISLRMGYAYTNHLSQSFNYSLMERGVSGIWDHSSQYILDNQGHSLLSQLGTVIQYDTRDRRMMPHKGFILRLGGDVAGLGGDARYLRGKFDAAYYLPLDDLMGNHDWTVEFKAGTGFMTDWGHGKDWIIDNFYLGGNNLRGFWDGGVGPRAIGQGYQILGPNGQNRAGEDMLGGRFIYTGSMTVHFPIPYASSMGLRGRAFIDTGSLAGLRVRRRLTNPIKDGIPNSKGEILYQGVSGDTLTPRISAGAGISWKSPFGLLNIDCGIPIKRSYNDRTQLLRFGFGQQF
ncbi:MAG: outer membrane protein assembly factor BamA [Acetobacter aceti]|uniref:Outer membrane protein assembly factor BamA n=1 Tax=Acetobacter aceti TaxID=435 RepID=A0A1U9KHX6_ACEAC|nr:outer membrane protein assembly factor BamA [Acetobacter aceti]AQS85415.1 outer membrane protein assembly factor BamA [Acetobacter aceti]